MCLPYKLVKIERIELEFSLEGKKIEATSLLSEYAKRKLNSRTEDQGHFLTYPAANVS